MKASRRNRANARAQAERQRGGPPPLSKYAAKRRGELVPEPGSAQEAYRTAMYAYFKGDDDAQDA